MGILKNLVNAKVSGNVGSMNFRKRGSQVVVAERSYTNLSKGKGATASQRAHRSRLANIVNFFRVIAAIEARAWQNKPENNSDFNMFSKYNLAASPIFLTKQETQARACVIAPYEVSRGSLAALAQSFDDAKFNTGVLIGDGFSLDQNTLGTFSQAVIDNNPDWQNGDKLSVALLVHNIVEVSGINVPKVGVTYIEITLDVEATTPLTAIANFAMAAPALNADGMLVFGYACNAAFAIHSRKTNGILETSSQFIVMANVADALYTQYSSDAQKELAMASYGYQADVLLTPGAVTETPAADVKVANVTSVLYGDAALVNGGSIEAGSVLTINGTDLTNNNVAVMVDGVKYVAQSASATSRTYTLSAAGTLTIAVNGAVRYSVTITANTDAVVTKITLGSNNYATPQSNLSAVFGLSSALSVEGTNLGTLSATGCALSDVGGSATNRTAKVNFHNIGNFTISVGSVVVLSGHVDDDGGLNV